MQISKAKGVETPRSYVVKRLLARYDVIGERYSLFPSSTPVKYRIWRPNLNTAPETCVKVAVPFRRACEPAGTNLFLTRRVWNVRSLDSCDRCSENVDPISPNPYMQQVGNETINQCVPISFITVFLLDLTMIPLAVNVLSIYTSFFQILLTLDNFFLLFAGFHSKLNHI